MSQRDEALATLNAWLARRDQNISSSYEAAWAIAEYRDAFVFSPSGGRRSNLLYVVRGTRVMSFSPATATLDEVYADLSDASDATATD